MSNPSLVSAIYAAQIFTTVSSVAWLLVPSWFLITLLVLVLPLVMGRVYCSFFCPAGFLQDLGFYVGRVLKIKGRRVPLFSGLRLGVLVFCGVAIAIKSSSYGYVDHFTNFSRFIGLFTASREDGFLTAYAILFGFVIILFPIFWPRFFCHTLCPSGSLFSVFQRKSILKVTPSKTPCANCKKCAVSCPSLCIDQAGVILHDHCVMCFECVFDCPVKSFEISIRRPFGRKRVDKVGHGAGRRRFLRQGFAISLGVVLAGFSKKFSNIATVETQIIAPPGAGSVRQFLTKCVSCNLCIGVCPTKVLRPLSTRVTFPDASKPHMNYAKAYCSYECTECQKICPTGAIAAQSLEEKKLTKIGQADLRPYLCIPFAEHRDCGACGEICPTGAIEMIEKSGVRIPVLQNQYCIGCGACQSACPVKPEAIRVAPLAVHSLAYDPRVGDDVKKEKGNRSEDSGFPF